MSELLATPNLGTGSQEDRDRVDFARMRALRADRVFAAMDEHGLDALVLGREANVRYVSGARRLWTAGSRPFGPTCLVVAATRSVQLLSFSASYEGIPAELQPEDIYPLSWNPLTVIERFRATPGVAEAARVGVDGLSPLFEALLPQAFPAATVVGADHVLARVRRTKLPDELVCIRTAAAIAEAALVAAIDRVAPGTPEKDLQAAYLDRMCQVGTSQFAQQGTFTAIGPDGALRWTTGAGALDEGVPVALAGGALFAGYEGSLARTWWCGRQAGPTDADRAPRQRWDDLFGRLLDELRPGRTGADLARVAEPEAADPACQVAVGSVGLGREALVWAPHLDPEVAAAEELEADVVVAVRAFVPGPRGGYLGEETVRIGDGGPELLTTLAHDLGPR